MNAAKPGGLSSARWDLSSPFQEAHLADVFGIWSQDREVKLQIELFPIYVQVVIASALPVL